jgi:hypothetical protein
MELEQVIGYFGSTLTTEDKHGISGYCHRKVTAGWRVLPYLLNFLPSTWFTRL